jgi:thioredoxin-related protein
MRRKGLLLASALLGTLWLSAGVAGAGEIRWVKSLDQALQQAKRANKLVMVDFYTDWCTWCKRLDRDTYTNDRVVQLSTQFVSVKVNAEKEGRSAAQRYGVNGFPTILFLTGGGEVAGKITGYRPPQPFADEMSRIATAHREYPALVQRVKANPKDGTSAAKLTIIYAGRGRAQQAEQTLRLAAAADPENRSGQLAKAYNAVGDLYQENQQFDRAIPLFRQGLKVSRTPYDNAYSRISIAVCLFSQKRMKEAEPDLNAILAMPNAPAEMKQMAQRMLDYMRRGE